MPNLHDSILSAIGQTPIVRLRSFEPSGVRIYGKVESFNPGGSVKDRMALAVIEEAERLGALRPGQTVVEATSGNMGIGLAIVCAQKGYPLIIVMAENFSVERRKPLRFLGAKVVLTPAALRGTGMIAKAKELATQNGWFFVRQFENPANADAHARTTAREIIDAFTGERLDCFVSGYGTGGTLNGVARVLRAQRPDIRILACEPDNAPLLAGGGEQARNPDGSPAMNHPAFRPHVMQGWTPDFIPLLTQQMIDARHIDGLLPIDGNAALENSRRLATEERVLAGISSGATLAGAIAAAHSLPAGSTVLCMLPDTGERYLSTPLFEHISADMNEVEMEISRSSPSSRFDAPATPAAPASSVMAMQSDNAAETFVNEALSDPTQPVVMFALEWCEFCWSARRLFQAMGVSFRSIDIDSAALQENGFGGRIRSAISARTCCATIPQIFVSGEFIDGAMDVLDAYASGDLHARLANSGVVTRDKGGLDPRSFLPAWLHKRSA